MRECPACFGKGTIRFKIQKRAIVCPVCHGLKYFKLSNNEKLKKVEKKILVMLDPLSKNCLCTMHERCRWCYGAQADIMRGKIEALREVLYFLEDLY